MLRLRRLAIATVLVLAVGYGLVVGILYFGQRDFLYHPSAVPGVPAANGPPIQIVPLRSADGEDLVSWYLPAAEDRPTILFFSGNGESLQLQTGRWRRFADAGVGFLALAYRGYDGSTGSPTEAGLHLDAEAAYAWLAGEVGAENIVIHGFSLGTGVATKLASDHPARALVLEAPYTATVDVAAELYPLVPVRLLMKDTYRSRDWIGEADMPVLIVHGDADSVIPFHFGQELFSMAPQPKTFVRMVGSDHNTLARDGLYDHIWRFLGVPFAGTTAYQGQSAAFEVIEENQVGP